MPTYGDLTTTTSYTTTKSMASHQASSSILKKFVLPITGVSSFKPSNKKQKKEAQTRVLHVGIERPYMKTMWSHISITFSQEDLCLKDYPHRDAMVISCVVTGFMVHIVLIDTCSAAYIIFVKAFKQMQEPKDKIQHSAFPLCCFEGKQVMALGKLTMPITFSYVNNTRREEVMFEIVYINFSNNAIIGRGTLNIFGTVLHSTYLCMKIPSNHGVISVYGRQEAARRAEGTLQEPKIIYNIDEAEAQTQESEKQVKDKASLVDQPKLVLLYEDVKDQMVFFGNPLTLEKESYLKRFLFHNKNLFAWSANDLCGVDKIIIEHALNVDPNNRPQKQKLRKMS
jgi:hypothetical protein